MMTLTINSKTLALLAAKPAERAAIAKPRIRVIEFGRYEVLSSKGERWYTVRCNSERKTITCSCPSTSACLHMASVLPVHVNYARELNKC